MKKFFNYLFLELFVIPLTIISVLAWFSIIGWIISFIWLIILGEWKLIFIGLSFLITILGRFVFTLFLFPSMGIVFLLIPLIKSLENSDDRSYFKNSSFLHGIIKYFRDSNIKFMVKLKFCLLVLSSIIQKLFFISGIVVWAICVLKFFIINSEEESIIPVLIFSYSVTYFIVAFFSYEDQKSGQKYSEITSIAFGCGYILSILIVLFNAQISFPNNLSSFDIFSIIGIIMFVSIAIGEMVAGKKGFRDWKNIHCPSD